jgi:hypothetical protein
MSRARRKFPIIAGLGIALSASVFAGPGSSAQAGEAGTGAFPETTFQVYTPLAGNREIARRLLDPIASAAVTEAMTRAGTIDQQPIDLSQEKFLLYVPPAPDTGSYALVVFVPPWKKARLPDNWADVMDRYHAIIVVADNSGNTESDLARRVPLALLAEFNVASRYKIDPARIFIAGFSGGSRVAERLALGYPDIFRGAILNEGSYPVGGARGLPLPPRGLALTLQERSRIFLLMGDGDSDFVIAAQADALSLRKVCVNQLGNGAMLHTSHMFADPITLSRAFEFLLAPPPADRAELDACRSRLEADIAARLHDADQLRSAGKTAEAKSAAHDIDLAYGGLAAPHVIELWDAP